MTINILTMKNRADEVFLVYDHLLSKGVKSEAAAVLTNTTFASLSAQMEGSRIATQISELTDSLPDLINRGLRGG